MADKSADTLSDAGYVDIRQSDIVEVTAVASSYDADLLGAAGDSYIIELNVLNSAAFNLIE